MIKVTSIPNLLSPKDRKVVEIPFKPQYTVKQYLDEVGLPHENLRYIVAGKVRPLDHVVEHGSDIIVMAEIQDPISIGTAITFAFTWLATNAVLVGMVAIAVGYYVYSTMSVKKASMPSFGTTSQGGGIDESSPTYGWDGVTTTQQVGTPIPVIYGQHNFGGNKIIKL